VGLVVVVGIVDVVVLVVVVAGLVAEIICKITITFRKQKK
jgi:hypothetical protein